MPFPAHEIAFNGRTQPLDVWARETGIPPATLRSRLFKLNWSVERALTQRPDKRFRAGGRKRASAPRPCPELKRHQDGRAYCRWHEQIKNRTGMAAVTVMQRAAGRMIKHAATFASHWLACRCWR
jgi:hypothetical protein